MADIHSTPPPLQSQPTAKERKYDRQLRLWAASGQAALETAHILLINSGTGVVGVEALKNLVLPGIGQFTIQESAQVTESDLGVNFFLVDEDLGKFRAEQARERLLELNPDVQGHAISEPLETFISRSDALTPYTFILAVLPLPPDALSVLSQHASEARVPIFYIHSIGFYAHFTAQIPDAFPIVDTHPDPTSTSDLRLLEPWPELLKLAQDTSHNLESMPDDDHGHIPYVILLLHYLEKWKTAHGGATPTAYKDKTAFRDLIRSGMRTSSSAGDEENYEEAISAVLKTLNPHTPSSSVKDVLTAPESKNLTSRTPSFWVIAHAINDFYVRNGVLPLSGSLPDMKAKSADYITLQNTYRLKAQQDVDAVEADVRQLEQQLARTHPIPRDEVAAFCKSAGSVKLVRGRTPQLAHPTTWGDRAAAMATQLSMPDSLLTLYIAFLAYDTYASTHDLFNVGLHRANTRDSYEAEAEKVVGIAESYIDHLLKEAGEHLDEPEYSDVKTAAGNCARELVRAGGAELHNVSAVMGGVVAQEAIKTITEQYVPVDNTCLFDGVGGGMGVLRL